jgi:hypothetical protein
MYLFDANCSVGTWPTDRPAYETVDGLLTEMDRLSIQKALVSHTLGQHYDPAYANQLLIQELAGHERLLPCWTLLPLSCGEMGTLKELLGQMADADVRAVRLYPRDHSYALEDWQCGDLLTALSERGYVVLLDIEQTDWSQVEGVCRTYADLSLVVTHTGYRHLRYLYAQMARHPNLYCDLSNFSTFLGVEETLSRFGGSRLLFGTGLPAHDPGGPIARVFYTPAPPSHIEAMAHGNLEALLSRVRPGQEGVR